jgi:hypothetical protein
MTMPWPRHRTEVAGAYRGCGRPVIALDWPLGHHERGPKLYAVSRTYDDVAHRTTLGQTVVTAVVAHCERIDGLDMVSQAPLNLHAEAARLARDRQNEL